MATWRIPQSLRLRFSDVIEELRSIARLAAPVEEELAHPVAVACRRAEALLVALPDQFMDAVFFGDRVVPA